MAERYESHFGKSPAELKAWFASLKPAHLRGRAKVMEYTVGPNGGSVLNSIQLGPGAGVFVDAEGNPVLRLNTGNPVYGGAHAVTMANKLDNDLVAGETRGAFDADADASLEAGDSGFIADNAEVSADPSASPAALLAQNPSETTVKNPGNSTGAGAFLPAIGLISSLYLLHSGGNDVAGTPPVPEPASMAVLATGLAFTIRRKRRK
ncbi:MAG: PEP-CTERM sorting domain-containing protein [Fimbriimonas sp.]